MQYLRDALVMMSDAFAQTVFHLLSDIQVSKSRKQILKFSFESEIYILFISALYSSLKWFKPKKWMHIIIW